jgi:hypothetical protein
MFRRSFLKNTMLGIPAISGALPSHTNNKKLQKPIIISTWDFGKAANAEGWKTLSANGHALFSFRTIDGVDCRNLVRCICLIPDLSSLVGLERTDNHGKSTINALSLLIDQAVGHLHLIYSLPYSLDYTRLQDPSQQKFY